jgi:cytochrome c oxidase subunit 2
MHSIATAMQFPLADKVQAFAWFPDGASSFAPQVDYLFTFILWVCILFFVPMMAAMVYFMWAYRERPGYRGSTEALHNTPLEITWTVIPTAIAVYIFWEGAIGYLDMARIPKGTVDVNVTAKKWVWAFKYENGGENSFEKVGNADMPVLVLPVNKDVKLIMRSEDVLHSFYIPAFRVKRDVVPGRYSYMWFRPTKTGTFDLFCTEYCGDNHSNMLGKVQVVEEEEYKRALEKAVQEPEDPLERGKLLYKRLGCSTCHNAGSEGASGPGPSYNGSWGKEVPLETGAKEIFDENYVRNSILNPQFQARKGYGAASPMNSYAGRIKDVQIDALIEFMKSLQNEAPRAK